MVFNSLFCDVKRESLFLCSSTAQEKLFVDKLTASASSNASDKNLQVLSSSFVFAFTR